MAQKGEGDTLTLSNFNWDEIGESFYGPKAVTVTDNLESADVSLIIPPLKVTRSLVIVGSKKPSNASIEFAHDNKSVAVLIHMKDVKESSWKKSQRYAWRVLKLPGEITSASYKVKDGLILVNLKKAKSESWQSSLSDGLETDRKEEDDE